MHHWVHTLLRFMTLTTTFSVTIFIHIDSSVVMINSFREELCLAYIILTIFKESVIWRAYHVIVETVKQKEDNFFLEMETP